VGAKAAPTKGPRSKRPNPNDKKVGRWEPGEEEEDG